MRIGIHNLKTLSQEDTNKKQHGGTRLGNFPVSSFNQHLLSCYKIFGRGAECILTS